MNDEIELGDRVAVALAYENEETDPDFRDRDLAMVWAEELEAGEEENDGTHGEDRVG